MALELLLCSIAITLQTLLDFSSCDEKMQIKKSAWSAIEHWIIHCDNNYFLKPTHMLLQNLLSKQR